MMTAKDDVRGCLIGHWMKLCVLPISCQSVWEVHVTADLGFHSVLSVTPGLKRSVICVWVELFVRDAVETREVICRWMHAQE